MRRPDRIRWLARRPLTACAAAVVVVIFGTAWVSAAPAGKPRTRPPTDAKTFELRGAVAGLLYPGVDRTVTIEIENPYSFAIDVTGIIVAVEQASTGCAGTQVGISPFSGSARVGAHQSTTVRLDVRLGLHADDHCQDATFPLTFSAAATRAG